MVMKEENIGIVIKRKTSNRLNSMRRGRDTYDDVINRILKEMK